jgi:hypothetical protein
MVPVGQWAASDPWYFRNRLSAGEFVPCTTFLQSPVERSSGKWRTRNLVNSALAPLRDAGTASTLSGPAAAIIMDARPSRRVEVWSCRAAGHAGPVAPVDRCTGSAVES